MNEKIKTSKNNIVTSIFILLLFSPITTVAAVYNAILEQIKPGSITIVGETHKKHESTGLFQNLAIDVLRHHPCVVIGLEIASDQQSTLDAVMQGRASVNEITLWPQVEHAAFRRMIENFGGFQRQGRCIKVIAIDSGVDNTVNRDVWMALSLAEQFAGNPILVLLGGLHTLKKVEWITSHGRPSVAEILSNKGFQVNSFPQRWIPDKCPGNSERRGRFVSLKNPEALTLLNESLMALVKAKRHRSTKGVIDGFVVWECDLK